MLSPAGAIYDLAGRLLRAGRTPERAAVPVICIGNVVAGGAGKTPVAIAVAEMLAKREVAFLSRGYGGRERGPVRVDPAAHDARAVGDEPLLLARHGPTWVSANRPAGARAATGEGAGLIVMDDGFQNPSLHKDVSILVFDGETGIGNGHVMPAGPLRETLDAGFARADAAVIVGEDRTRLSERIGSRVPVFAARLQPTPEAEGLSGRRVLAFAGIGRPEKFFRTLAEMGCDVVATHAYADHAPYDAERIMRLCEDAAAADAIPVTTEKDLVRLPAEARAMVRAVPVILAWEEPERVAEFLADRLG
ncbi:MAG: tetraacyldisaccharide 4'-kinase [Alphaproteobacteria bacterium]|nr:tetraacyldisaccharide 4'-kinase [Alphaproteobacteria bacterium]